MQFGVADGFARSSVHVWLKPPPLNDIVTVEVPLNVIVTCDVPAGMPPMAAGVFGYLGYDMVRQMERLAQQHMFSKDEPSAEATEVTAEPATETQETGEQSESHESALG